MPSIERFLEFNTWLQNYSVLECYSVVSDQRERSQRELGRVLNGRWLKEGNPQQAWERLDRTTKQVRHTQPMVAMAFWTLVGLCSWDLLNIWNDTAGVGSLKNDNISQVLCSLQTRGGFQVCVHYQSRFRVSGIFITQIGFTWVSP